MPSSPHRAAPLRLALIAALLASASCKSIPDWYAMPMQRQPVLVDEPSGTKSFIEMSDPEAPVYFLGGINRDTSGDAWRWVAPRSALAFRLPQREGWRFIADLTVPEITFKETGPVTITITINGHPFETLRFDQHGDKHVEKPVPAAWIRPMEANIASMTADRFWTSPSDGAQFAFILSRAGFRR
ncbi:MAG: hypothetical protein HYS04_15345 [Acidobacteria bacterium]|nr:hypothetical protein [Acidobacteriota bacterium]